MNDADFSPAELATTGSPVAGLSSEHHIRGTRRTAERAHNKSREIQLSAKGRRIMSWLA
jgi:hypothetical protein